MLALIGLSGCVTLPAMETGRTLDRGEAKLMVGATLGTYAERSIAGPNDTGLVYDDPEEEPAELVGEYLPVIEVGRVVGLGNRTDIALRINSATFVTARVKHQFLGTPTSLLAASVGLEGSLNAGMALAGGFAYTYGAVPLYLSVHPREGLAIYAVPRYALVGVTAVAPPPDARRKGATSWDFPALSYGVTLGSERVVAIELTHLGQTFLPSQASLGLRLRMR